MRNRYASDVPAVQNLSVPSGIRFSPPRGALFIGRKEYRMNATALLALAYGTICLVYVAEWVHQI